MAETANGADGARVTLAEIAGEAKVSLATISKRLVGFTKVRIPAGASVHISVDIPIELAGFTGRTERIIEAGDLIFGFGRSSGEIPLTQTIAVTGPERALGHDRVMHPTWTIE